MSDIDFFQVLVRWRPGQLSLDEGAERCAATVRALAAVWPDCAVWTLGSSAATAVEATDPDLPRRLVPKLRAARDRKLHADSDSLGDANLTLTPSPFNGVSVALTHDNPEPKVAQLQVKCKGAAAARLADDPDKVRDLLRTLAGVWDATLGYVGLRVLNQYQPFGHDWRPYFGWATWLAKDLATVDADVASATVTETGGGQLIVLHDAPAEIRRESIDDLVAHTRLADGTPLPDVPG
jgi:hypothetical protein